MMKQPAENPNATLEETLAAARQSVPPAAQPSDEEIAEVARELWQNRKGNGGSAEEDWFRAVEIVRQRRAASTVIPDSGNLSHAGESYPLDTSAARIQAQQKWKERSEVENTTSTGGTYSGSGAMRDRMNEGRERMNEMMENEPRSMPRMEHREGRIARSLEQQTARIPSDAWLWAAVGSIGLSLAMELSGKEKTANFIGHWAPTFLIFGLYNKMVKLQGSDGI